MARSNSRLFTESEWAQLTEHLSLSPRQIQIIRLLCDGHKNYSAASTLGISSETVRTHLKQVYAKLGVSDRFELLCLLVETSRNNHPPKRLHPNR